MFSLTKVPIVYGKELETTQTPVSFRSNDGVVLQGTIVSPVSANKKYPAILMVSGAGTGKRDVFQKEAEAFAKQGIVTLIYDKRTKGYSMTSRDYSLLADDAIAGMNLLRNRNNVDPNRVGIYGLSEGGWVAPLAAVRDPKTAFVIVAGAVGHTPSQQQAWSYGEFLRHGKVKGSLLPTMQETVMKQLIGVKLYPEYDYDTIPVWKEVKQPVLAMWGSYDREAVTKQSSQIITNALQQGGNTHYIIRFIKGARHNLQKTYNKGFDRPNSLTPGVADLVVSWVYGLENKLPSIHIDSNISLPEAPQSKSLPPLKWYESTWLQLFIFILLLFAFVQIPVMTIYRKWKKGDSNTPNLKLENWLAIIGLTTILGTIIYLLFMVMTAANLVGPVIFGQPIPWMILRILAASIIILTIIIIVKWWKHPTRIPIGIRIQLCGLIFAGILFIPWGIYWGLLD